MTERLDDQGHGDKAKSSTPLSDALDLNTLDSNDIRAWRTLARELENRIACIADFDAESIALAEESARTWIPVGERLPSPHTDNDFIVATRSGYVTALNFGEHGWYSGHANEEEAKDGYWNGCVTHWQVLPEAPVENNARTL